MSCRLKKMIEVLLELTLLLLTVVIMAPSPDCFCYSTSVILNPSQAVHRLAYSLEVSLMNVFPFGACLWKDSCKQGTSLTQLHVGEALKKGRLILLM